FNKPCTEFLLEVKKLIDAGKVKVIIDSVHPLENLMEAFKVQKSSRSKGKIIIEVAKDYKLKSQIEVDLDTLLHMTNSHLFAALSCVALALLSSMDLTRAEELCSITPYSYSGAKTAHPELTTAIDTLEKYAIASWYTDRQSSAERSSMISDMLSQCSEDTRLSIVVYGIPNKDCAGGFSSSGSVTSTSDYQAFLKELTDAVGSRKVLYVVEPDALGLLTQDGGCGASAGYLENLKVAVEALSANPNAELYLDVGYWMLAYGSSAANVATAMKDISSSGRVKGVTINTSNYRSNDEVADYCTTFQNAMGSTDMKCIVDTSRNFNGSPTKDWCNIATAGVGKKPTSDTGYPNLDYFMWIKVPGESDGECMTGSVMGPSAGAFFAEGFKSLWDQGYFVKELGMATIEASATTATDISTTVAGKTKAPSSKPESGSGSDENNAAGTVAPVDINWTEAPTTTTQVTTAPVTVTTSPSIIAPATTAPVDTTESTSQSTSTTQARTGCKAKKRRLRTL
ncbi:hypothetical protein BBJ29_010031, partial [Phytophthora kernoviae]